MPADNLEYSIKVKIESVLLASKMIIFKRVLRVHMLAVLYYSLSVRKGFCVQEQTLQ